MNCTTALDTANSKSSGISEATNNSGLPLERALESLVELGGILEIDDVDVSVCRANYAQIISNIHGVDSFLALDRRSRSLLPHIPVLDSLVP